MISKSRRHNIPLATLRQGNGDMLDIDVHQNIRMSDVTFSTSWTQTISQYCSTSWIMLVLQTFWPLLKLTQTESGFEA